MAIIDFSIESTHPYTTLGDHKRQLRRVQNLVESADSIVEHSRTSIRSLLELPMNYPLSFHSNLTGAPIHDASWHLPQIALEMARYDSLLVETWRGFGIPGRLILGIGKVDAIGERVDSEDFLSLIHLLGHVADDMNRRGLPIIRQETRYKKAVLTHALSQHPLIGARMIADEKRPSVISFQCSKRGLTQYLRHHGIVLSESSGEILSACNFPAHSKEQFDMLADRISLWS